MATPQVHLAYVPRGVGLACALVYLRKDPDVCGWWLGARGAETVTAYFRLEAFYTAGRTLFYATADSDLYGGWRYDLTSGRPQEIHPLAVDSDLAHELEQLQDAFVSEWLSLPGSTHAEQEQRAYHDAELAQGSVNIRFARLNKLDKQAPVWVYYSHGFEAAVLEFLGKRWPLDYGKA
jgi:hypothetical protein